MSERRRPSQAGSNARPQGTRPPQKKRRRTRVRGRFYVFIAIAAVLVVGLGVVIGTMMNKDDRPTAAPTAQPTNALVQATDDGSAAVATADSSSAGDISALLGNQDAVIQGLSKEQMVKVEDLSVTQGLDENWMNVLLLGSDARTKEESSRTDTMIICSINKKSGEVKLTSIMRDMAVDFDDIGSYNGTYRLNAANYFGGPELAMKTINKCFGMNIQSYVMVDFTSFSIIAEKLGGIDIEITEAEMNQINKNAVQQAKLAAKAGIDESALSATNVYLETFGANTHLNGRQTLAFARIRKIDSDFSRAERQRTVLVALMDKVKTKSMLDVLSLANSLSGYVTTNLSVGQIMDVVKPVLTSDISDVKQCRLPINDSYKQETRNEQSMLYDTDWNANTQALYSFIYN